MSLFFTLSWLLLSGSFSLTLSEIWKKDVGKDIEIGPSADGWTSVTLTCRSDVMKVRVNFPKSFSGVVYTRGNYGEDSACMTDPEGESSVEMILPNSVCNVIQTEQWRSSTLIVQRDDFLIFQGDTAFTFNCSVNGHVYSAQIDIASPDPGSLPLPEDRRSSVRSETNTVVFTPADVRPESLTGTRRPMQTDITPEDLTTDDHQDDHEDDHKNDHEDDHKNDHEDAAAPSPTRPPPPRRSSATVEKVEL